jgi:hypothetical protein
MGWTMLYLFVALKVPLLVACWLIWWAVHQEPDYAGDEDDGGSRVRPHPVPRLPHAPRRGPHGGDAFASPPRVRPPAPAKAREPAQ